MIRGEENLIIVLHAALRISLDKVLRPGRVHCGDERPNEVHLLASIFQNNFWIIRLTAEKIRCENHRQVRRIHLRQGHDVGLREVLEEMDQICEHLERGRNN